MIELEYVNLLVASAAVLFAFLAWRVAKAGNNISLHDFKVRIFVKVLDIHEMIDSDVAHARNAHASYKLNKQIQLAEFVFKKNVVDEMKRSLDKMAAYQKFIDIDTLPRDEEEARARGIARQSALDSSVEQSRRVVEVMARDMKLKPSFRERMGREVVG